MKVEQEPKRQSGPGHDERPERPPAILRAWRYSRRNPYQLVGHVYNHPNPLLTDGKLIRTSRVIWIREDVGLAQTLNTLYILRDRLA